MISLEQVVKVYRAHQRPPGVWESVKSFFWRQYVDVRALEGISLSIREGEMVGLLGPNGAGKTTALKILSGLLYPTSGKVEVNGHVPQKRGTAFLKSISMVFGHRRTLAWDLTAEDSFLLRRALYEVPAEDYRKVSTELIERLTLGAVIKKPVRLLSMGERMKCELVAALLHRPRVLFLDEPTVGLDVGTQLAIRDFIGSYNRESGATVILTSHYMADVSALASRIVLIDKGQLRFDGSLEEFIAVAPSAKVLVVKFNKPIDRASLETLGRVRLLRGHEAQVVVPAEQSVALAQRALTELQVSDVGFSDLPVEELLSHSFQVTTKA